MKMKTSGSSTCGQILPYLRLAQKVSLLQECKLMTICTMIAIWLTTSSENSTKKEKVHSSVKQLHKIKENKEINSHTARKRKSVRGEYFKSASPVRNTSPSKNLCTDESGRKTSYRLLRDVIMENEPKEGVTTYAFEEKVRLRTASRFNNRQQDYLSILKEKSEVKRK